MDFFTCFTCEKRPQNNFCRENFSVEKTIPFPTADHNQPITIANQKQQHKCDICERIFSKLIQLNMHKKVVHGKAPRIMEESQQISDENNKKVNKNDMKTTEFRCNFCLFSTESDKILKNHAFKVHKTFENYRFESNFKTDNDNVNKLEEIPACTVS